jgi:hypothetical protein
MNRSQECVLYRRHLAAGDAVWRQDVPDTVWRHDAAITAWQQAAAITKLPPLPSGHRYNYVEHARTTARNCKLSTDQDRLTVFALRATNK